MNRQPGTGLASVGLDFNREGNDMMTNQCDGSGCEPCSIPCDWRPPVEAERFRLADLHTMTTEARLQAVCDGLNHADGSKDSYNRWDHAVLLAETYGLEVDEATQDATDPEVAYGIYFTEGSIWTGGGPWHVDFASLVD